MAPIIQPVDAQKVDVPTFCRLLVLLRFLPSLPPAVGLGLLVPPGPFVKSFFDILVNSIPCPPLRAQANNGKHVALVIPLGVAPNAPQVAHNWTESDPEVERRKDLIHEHVGVFEVVGQQEVELALVRVGIHVAAVVSDETA